jgi:hypothetical protein
MFAAYARIVPAVQVASLSPVFALAEVGLWILLAALAQGLALLFVRSFVTAQAAAALRGGCPSVPAIVGRVFRQAGARLVGQRILQGLIYLGLFAAAMIVLVVAAAFSPGAESAAASMGVFLLFYLGTFVVWVWLWCRFSFTLESVVIDGSRAGQSFGLSTSLVRRSWWRVFGYRLLFSIMLGFAASLIATPVVFFATIRAYARYLSDLVEGASGTGSLTDMLRSMGSGMPLRLALFMYLQSLLNAFFTPVFMTLLYFEMKRRRAELPGQPTPLPDPVPVPPAAPDTAPAAPADRQGTP